MKSLGVIPARFSSTRLPGKPLAEIGDKAMVKWVYDAAIKSKLDSVVVATESDEVFNYCVENSMSAVMTSDDCQTGTERVVQVSKMSQYKDFDVYVNIQGDEPFLDPLQIDGLAAICDGETEIATQMIVCTDSSVLFDMGEVKIVLNEKNEALYFSRSVIPHIKNKPQEEWHNFHTYHRHVGMYAYRQDILKEICQLAPSSLEVAESLEQLRWLQNGYTIRCAPTSFESHCIDTPEDIQKVLRLMNPS